MLAGIRSRLTYANVVASLALFVALGGVAWAAATINSGDVVNNSLRSVDLKDGKGVKGADVVPDSLTGEHLQESSLDQVPSAANTESAANAEALDGKDSGEFQEVGSEAWTPLALNDGSNRGFDPPGTSCSWLNMGEGFNDASYRRDQDGDVHVRGLVRASDGEFNECSNGGQHDAVVATLPVGYRPGATNLFTVTSNSKPARLDVRTLGDLRMQPNYPLFSDAEEWLSLDGISFACAPSGQDGCP